MFHIISIEKTTIGTHGVQSWEEEQTPDGFAFCPEEMIEAFVASKGFVNITVADGTVTAMTENTEAREAWEAQPKTTPEPSPEEDRDAMLADQEYRLTLLELGVM